MGDIRAFLPAQKARSGSRVASTYSVPVSSLNSKDVEAHQKYLTLQARCSFGAPPPAFEAWSIVDGVLHVPRFYGMHRFGPAETDDRVEGDAINISFQGQLNEVQLRANAATDEKHFSRQGDGGCIICLPCGYGKTVWAIHQIVRLGQKACILVHKGILRDQWKASFERFCPGVKVGIIQGNVFQVDGYDVVIAMVMTMARREQDPRMDVFGVVCCDEAHHLAAPVMHQALGMFRARYVIALTATKERPDGLTPLLHWSLGEEGFRIERESEPVRVSVALFTGGTREVTTRDGNPLMSLMITNLAKHAGRNAFIASRILALHRVGRIIIILSDRLEQLRILKGMVLAGGIDENSIGLFTGTTKEAEREAQLSRPVIFSSFPMANEGLDRRELDTCIMASPKGRVTQCIGRVQRPCATKQSPLVIDIADDVSIFKQLRFKRQKEYQKNGYEVQVMSAHDATEEAWFR